MEKFHFVASTDRGLEEEVIKDLKENFGIYAETKGRKAKVFFTGTILDAIRLNFACRSINKVFLILNQGQILSLSDIIQILKDIPWEEYIPKNASINFSVSRVGVHSFTSIDIRNISMNFLRNRLKNVIINMQNPDVEIKIDIVDDWILVCLDLTGPSLHMRRYRAFNHPMPLKTTLAYLMVRISKWSEEEYLVDPMCGGGTILIEAAHKACKIPICEFRANEYSFWKLPFIPLDKARKIMNELLRQKRELENLKLAGSDINPDFVEGAKANAKKAKVDKYIIFKTADAREIVKNYGEKNIDVIITNPPYKLRDRKYLSDLYEKFIEGAYRALRDNGRIVMITSEIKLTEKILRKKGISFRYKKAFRYGRTPCKIYIIHK